MTLVRNEYMSGINSAYGYPEKFELQGQEFFKTYSLEREIGCPDLRMTGLIPPKDRICRFYGKKYPFVTFRNDAHIFPEFLANKYLVSDFECDDCNAKFGGYEDHLS